MAKEFQTLKKALEIFILQTLTYGLQDLRNQLIRPQPLLTIGTPSAVAQTAGGPIQPHNNNNRNKPYSNP